MQILGEHVGLSSLGLQSSSSKCVVLKLHRELGNYPLSATNSYSLTASHICEALNKSMFHNNQQVTYSPRPMTACLTKSSANLC